jgi:Fe-S-cluster-containing hydrogenase component 2
MDAITYDDGVAVVDLSACIGCGLCVTTCPDEAIRLFEKPETKTPPTTEKALYMKILLERYGPLGAARIAGKKALGMKI